MIARILDAICYKDLEKYMVCNRWSEQMEGSVGYATINSLLQSCGFAPSCVHKCFAFSSASFASHWTIHESTK